jgi:hypothetical protein
MLVAELEDVLPELEVLEVLDELLLPFELFEFLLHAIANTRAASDSPSTLIVASFLFIVFPENSLDIS